MTIYETIIELENITTTQNVSFLVNNTVRYNATYNISYDVSRNVSYDVVYNQTYNITYNTTVNVTEYVNTTMNVTTTYNISSHQPVDVVLALDASARELIAASRDASPTLASTRARVASRPFAFAFASA